MCVDYSHFSTRFKIISNQQAYITITIRYNFLFPYFYLIIYSNDFTYFKPFPVYVPSVNVYFVSLIITKITQTFSLWIMLHENHSYNIKCMLFFQYVKSLSTDALFSLLLKYTLKSFKKYLMYCRKGCFEQIVKDL